MIEQEYAMIEQEKHNTYIHGICILYIYIHGQETKTGSIPQSILQKYCS